MPPISKDKALINAGRDMAYTEKAILELLQAFKRNNPRIDFAGIRIFDKLNDCTGGRDISEVHIDYEVIEKC